MYDAYTENLGDFGYRELDMAAELLSAIKNGLPWDFDDDGMRIGFNRNSGDVFLTNDEYQVAMVDDDGELYSFYSTPYSGYEGSAEDLAYEFRNNPDGWDSDDIEYLKDVVRGGVDAGEIEETDEDIQFVLNYGETTEETEEE